MKTNTSRAGLPTVSIIIVNYNGWSMLQECLVAVEALDYPRELFEVIVVDNGSTDGSPTRIRERFPRIRLLTNGENLGFAKPNNQAARLAGGEYLALLNNDAVPERDWLRELVATGKRTGAECVGSVILNQDGTAVDFIEGNLSFYGHGSQLLFGQPMPEIPPRFKQDREVLFACGGAMLIRRDVYLACGGLDEDYFAYFEDVDLGWRLWVLGYRVVLSYQARVRHKQQGTSGKLMRERVRLLYERNALFTVYKNYEEHNVYPILSASLLLAVQKALALSHFDQEQFAITHTGELRGGLTHESEAIFVAISEFIRQLPTFRAKREWIQRSRKRSDNEILQLIPDPYHPAALALEFKMALRQIAAAFSLDDRLGLPYRPHVLLVSSDIIGDRMAGPGIRYWEMAKALSEHVRVSLAIPNEPEMEYPGIECFSTLDQERLHQEINYADVIITQGFVLEQYPVLKNANACLVIDLYDPFIIENMESLAREERSESFEVYERDLEALQEQLRLGDYFLCASTIQKDFWIGMLTAARIVNPEEYQKSRTLDHLFGIVPFGLPEEPPQHTRRVLKGVMRGIAETDKVIIWGGGIWNWFDPLTLLRAVAEIARERSDVKLLFMGTRSPSPFVPEMEMARQAVELARELGFLDRVVFFNEGWTPYEERQNYLLEADIAVSCHFNTLESRYAFRTRILDYIWAGLPIVCTSGDFFADVVRDQGLGIVVPCEDVTALKDALLTLLDDPEKAASCRNRVLAVRTRFTWREAVKPLVNYCRNPMPRAAKDHLVTAFHVPKGSMVPAGELVSGITIGQAFTVRHPNLCRVDVLLATYARTNKGRLILRLKDGLHGRILASQQVSLENVRDNTWHKFEFTPISDSENREFYIELEAPDSHPGNAITAWLLESEVPGARYYVNGLPAPGALQIHAFSLRISGRRNTLRVTGEEIKDLPNLPIPSLPAEVMSDAELVAALGDLREQIWLGKDANIKLKQIENQLVNLERIIEGLVINIHNINTWIQYVNKWLDRARRNLLVRFIRKVRRWVTDS